MKNRIIKTTITFALSLCCIFSFLTISKAHEVYASYYRYVNANSLIVRKTASSKGKVAGTPEEVAACVASYTGQFLKEKLAMDSPD